jgi:hypothetical protein
MSGFKTALHRNILDVFNEYGIQVMVPAYEGDPDQPKIVPKERWYAAPATDEVSNGLSVEINRERARDEVRVASKQSGTRESSKLGRS